MFGSKEREAIRVFLHDVYHQKAINARMKEIGDRFNEEELVVLVYRLKDEGILDGEEVGYLLGRIKKLYRRGEAQ